jgi:hypothetical protein
MERIHELISLFSENTYEIRYTNAKMMKICIMCGKPAVDFRDASSRIEYSISGLCQGCQDHYLMRCEMGENP